MAKQQVMDNSNITVKWADAQLYSPAPRHRRRLIMEWVKSLEFNNCLEAGCAQGYLVAEITKARPVVGHGCDISDEAISANRQCFPHIGFEVMDIAKQVWPGNRRFDLVICSEVLEHIEDWTTALSNLTQMTRRYLLLTVPSGKVHKIDRHIGHSSHFKGPELVTALNHLGFDPLHVRYWGFPFHSLYKYAINVIPSNSIYNSFGEQQYGFGKRLISDLLYLLFFGNDLFNSGGQLLVFAERKIPLFGTDSFDGGTQSCL